MYDNFNEAVSRIIEYNLDKLSTALPCIVVSVAENAVDVKSALLTRYRDDSVAEGATLLNVPLVTPGSSTALVNIPVKPGDIVLCIFSMRGLDAFKAGDGTPAAPTDFRMFDKRDAMAIPGIFPFEMHPNLKRVLPFNPDALSLTQDIGLPTESIVELSDAGITLKQGATSVVVSSAGVDITGLLTINGVPFPLHTHTGVTTGGGLSGPVSI